MAELRPFPSWESVLSAVECNIACMKSDEAKMRLVWVHLKAALATPTATTEGWVSVENGLPEGREEVWLVDRWGHTCLAVWNEVDDMWWRNAGGGRMAIPSPMYWQPKPALPDCDIIRAHISAMKPTSTGERDT